MTEYLDAMIEWFHGTQIPEQIQNVEVLALFQNPYFLVPFIVLVIYFLYKQAISNLLIMGICIGLWWFTGTDIVQSAVVDGEIQLSKVLPVIGVGVTAVAALIYLMFIKSD